MITAAGHRHFVDSAYCIGGLCAIGIEHATMPLRKALIKAQATD
jgi:hypothetical protein